MTNAERQSNYRKRGKAARTAIADIRMGLREGIVLSAAALKHAEFENRPDDIELQTKVLEHCWRAYDLAVLSVEAGYTTAPEHLK